MDWQEQKSLEVQACPEWAVEEQGRQTMQKLGRFLIDNLTTNALKINSFSPNIYDEFMSSEAKMDFCWHFIFSSYTVNQHLLLAFVREKTVWLQGHVQETNSSDVPVANAIILPHLRFPPAFIFPFGVSHIISCLLPSSELLF